MKLLLDENLPHDLRHYLPGHEPFTVAYLGWKGLENGALLAKAAEHGFDAVISQDAGIPYEQNAATLPVSLVMIQAKSNTMDALRPLIPELLEALSQLKPRTVVRVGR